MSDLYSMAYSSSSFRSSSLGWDLPNLGVFNADMSLVMENSGSQFFSASESDFSTGYLQDALLEFSDRHKRQRLLVFADDETDGSDAFVKNLWSSNGLNESFENVNHLRQIDGESDAQINISESRISKEAKLFTEIKTPEEEILSAPETLESSSSSYKDSVHSNDILEKGSEAKRMKKKRDIVPKMVYPFALIKPGGVEGDLTINDINERILMPPTRPVKHPVGEFACRPCVSPDGLGISGKTVVAFTRIHTRGRGSITIIRTKG